MDTATANGHANGGLQHREREREKDVEEAFVMADLKTEPAPNPPSKPGTRSSSPSAPLTIDDLPPPSRAKHPQSARAANIFYISLNTVSTIVTVFLNKVTFSDPQFKKLQISVAMWHFLATFLILFAASAPPFSLFKPIRLPIKDMLPICVLFTLFLLLNNLSLTFNPVGFYQLAKILTTPALVTLDYAIFRKTITLPRLSAVLISCVGVALTNGATARSNPLGAFVAVAAFVSTALYQIWIGKCLADMNVSAVQLLLNQAPIATLMLIPFVPFCDSFPDFSLVPTKVVLSVLGSGVGGSMINLSQFLVIGGTSPLTFNIVGLVKTIMIVALGWYGEGKYLRVQDIVGVMFALGGACWYAQLPQAAK